MFSFFFWSKGGVFRWSTRTHHGSVRTTTWTRLDRIPILSSDPRFPVGVLSVVLGEATRQCVWRGSATSPIWPRVRLDPDRGRSWFFGLETVHFLVCKDTPIPEQTLRRWRFGGSYQSQHKPTSRLKTVNFKGEVLERYPNFTF